jgi:hypothetical protein
LKSGIGSGNEGSLRQFREPPSSPALSTKIGPKMKLPDQPENVDISVQPILKECFAGKSALPLPDLLSSLVATRFAAGSEGAATW